MIPTLTEVGSIRGPGESTVIPSASVDESTVIRGDDSVETVGIKQPEVIPPRTDMDSEEPSTVLPSSTPLSPPLGRQTFFGADVDCLEQTRNINYSEIF